MEWDRVRSVLYGIPLSRREREDWGTSSESGYDTDLESLSSNRSKEDTIDFKSDRPLPAQSSPESLLSAGMQQLDLLTQRMNMMDNAEKLRNGSTRYKDIISKSTLIHSGRPTVYQVKPKKEMIGTLTKLMVGERNLNKTNRTVLLVGETGAGKSTLINALFNYTIGVKFEDEVWFQLVEEEKMNQTETQTSDVIVYEVFGYEDETLPYSLTIIDTPGFANTRGIKRDAMVSERLLDLFQSEDGVLQVNAVGLVMKASDDRLSGRLCYIFNSVMSLFGKNLEEKIVALMTHSDGRKPTNVLKFLEKAGVKCAKNEKNQAVYFLFNNMQEEDRTEDEDYLKYHNNLSEKGFRAFTDFLEKSAPRGLKTTTEVLKKRKQLTACIQNLQERIMGVEVKQTEIKQIREDLRKDGDEVKKGMSFLYEYLDQLRELNKQKEQLINEAYRHVIKLEEIALNIYSQSTYDNLVFLIEKMKETGDTEKLKKLEEMKGRLNTFD